MERYVWLDLTQKLKNQMKIKIEFTYGGVRIRVTSDLIGIKTL